MKKISVILVMSLLLLTSCSNANNKRDTTTTSSIQNKYKKNIEIDVDENLILDNLNKICSNVRNYGSEGEKRTGDYLSCKLKEYGYIANVQKFPIYKQTFNSTIHVNNKEYFKVNPYNSKVIGYGKNIIAKRDSHSNNKKTFYLTAHYDTTEYTKGVIDNGSGVSVVLEVARQLKNYNSPFNIVIVFFSGEEYFRSGSRAFISSLTDNEKKNAIGCINVDMVGEKDAGDVVMRLYGKGNNLISLMINSSLKNKLLIEDGGYSDDLSFYFGKIPSISLSNKNPNFDIDKKENQLSYVNLEELKNTAYLITNFLNKFSMDSYNKFLNKNISYCSNKKLDKLGVINGFKLYKINAHLLENGYDSETEYIYKNSKNEEYAIREKNLKFVSPNTYCDFKPLKEDTTWKYCINEELNSSTKLFYLNGSNFGEIKGNISKEDAMKILKIYCKRYGEFYYLE